ncbi:Uncharacterised protein [uncultured Anaerotruncus sp.]|uniref:Uncharacterized protein n=1 Tax=uncultured Anaerotruncus sp. TaxID=905011 RepID=A0A6N2UG17_9FIRM
MKERLNIVENQTEEIPAIPIERGEEFYQAAKELSEFIHSLPLSVEDNDRLIGMMVDQVLSAEWNAFSKGLRMGVDLAKWKGSPEQGNSPLPPS